MLERLKLLRGHLAYISLSSFLVQNAQNLYYSGAYENEHQELDFLSFRDYLSTLRIPEGKEIDFKAFEGFYNRYRSQTKVKDPYMLFEEFKGVITGSVTDKPYLSLEEYLALGVKQSVFTAEQRPEVYELFRKYLLFMQTEGYYDANILSHAYLELAKPMYDYVIVDEVQDLTNIQLKVILASLKNPVGFLFCGDANQIVHPNFFSWSALKTMFYKSELSTDIIRILHTNYRNAVRVTELANNLLRIKNLRFGSIDKESTHLINSVSGKEGTIEFLEDKPQVKGDLNRKTQHSTHFAVLVMTNDDKAEARKFFQTPLIFSIQEAKGLEYENIILLNFITNHEKEFRVISEGIDPEDLTGDLVYARNRNKEDRALDTYKFYINSLYVAITRAVQNLYIVEGATKHSLLRLLGLVKVAEKSALQEAKSSLDDWKTEARRLELQGKKEQSDAIRKIIAKQENKVVLTEEELAQLKIDALNPAHFNNQAKKKLFTYAVSESDHDLIHQLEALKYPEARKYFEKLDREFRLYAADCKADKIDAKHRVIVQHGVNFRNSQGVNGLFPAIDGAALKSLRYLTGAGADLMAKGEAEHTPLQHAILVNAVELHTIAYYKSRNEHYGPKLPVRSFPQVYGLLKTHSMSVETDNRLIKLGGQGMEYFLLNFMMGMTDHIQAVKTANAQHRMGGEEWFKDALQMRLREIALGLTMDDIMQFIELMPEEVLPAYRRKRPYVNAMLSKHEVSGNDPYNRRLFLRTARGVYNVNPDLRVVGY
jgi:hypothetical protein